MKYVTIYEFNPESFQIYHLLIPISLIIAGIIGYRLIRKHGFVNVFLVKAPFSQNYMNKTTEFFTFLFIIFGLIGLVISLIQIPRELEIKKEFDKLSNFKTIEFSEITSPVGISVFECIRNKEALIIDGQKFVFAKTGNINEYNLPQNLISERFSGTGLFRISFMNIDNQNIILKIENQK